MTPARSICAHVAGNAANSERVLVGGTWPWSRANRYYAEADALRDRLLAEGIQLYASPEGVR